MRVVLATGGTLGGFESLCSQNASQAIDQDRTAVRGAPRASQGTAKVAFPTRLQPALSARQDARAARLPGKNIWVALRDANASHAWRQMHGKHGGAASRQQPTAGAGTRMQLAQPLPLTPPSLYSPLSSHMHCSAVTRGQACPHGSRASSYLVAGILLCNQAMMVPKASSPDAGSRSGTLPGSHSCPLPSPSPAPPPPLPPLPLPLLPLAAFRLRAPLGAPCRACCAWMSLKRRA